MEGPVHISDHIASVVSRVAAELEQTVYYMFGHPLEVVGRLQQMSDSPVHKNQKFPLVALFTDIPVTKKPGFYGTARLQMIIACLTQPTYTADQRLELSFKAILQPIKVELIKQLSLYPQFTRPDELIYTEIERYYWGRQGLYGNQANIFNDHIDCIELQNIEVTIKVKKCLTLSNSI